MLGRKNGDGESGLKESPNIQGHKNLPLDLVKCSDLVLAVYDLFPSKSEDIWISHHGQVAHNCAMGKRNLGKILYSNNVLSLFNVVFEMPRCHNNFYTTRIFLFSCNGLPDRCTIFFQFWSILGLLTWDFCEPYCIR